MLNIFFDTETTGFVPGQICQLSFIVADNLKVIKAKNYFFKVNEMSSSAEEVHKISVKRSIELSGGKTFKDQFADFYQHFQQGMLVAHNISFDERFLVAELGRVGASLGPVSKRCTMKLFKDIMKMPLPHKASRYGNFKNPKLEEVLAYYDISTEAVMRYSKYLFGTDKVSFHDSRFDTAAIFVALNVCRDVRTGHNEWRKQFCKLREGVI